MGQGDRFLVPVFRKYVTIREKRGGNSHTISAPFFFEENT